MIEAIAVELGVPFQGVWLAAPPEQLVNRVANRRGDASDATPEVVRHQLGWYLDPLPGSWKEIDASGTPEMALQNARAAVAVIGTP
jgi:predicted kinase